MSDLNTLVPELPLFLTDADVREAFDWTGAATALYAAYRAAGKLEMFPPRTMARGDGIWLRTLSGIAAEAGVMGAKLIAASPRQCRASYLILLFDTASMEFRALMDGNSITGFRTAATSAIAADTLAPAGPISIGVIGSGFEAKNHVRALASLRAIASVRVYSPNPDSRAAFVEDLRDLGISIEPVAGSEAAVRGANVVVCAARSRDETPTLSGAWIEAGSTVVSIGSTLPEQREIDPETIRRADLIVADMVEEVAHDTGDMIAAAAAGVAFADRLVSLSDVLSGTVAGRTSDRQIILYKSVGAAVQDITIAAYCAAQAVKLGLGTSLPVTIAPVQKGK